MKMTDETKALIYSNLSERIEASDSLIKDVISDYGHIASGYLYTILVLGETPFNRSYPEDCIAYILSEGFEIESPDFPTCEANCIYRRLQDTYVETVLGVAYDDTINISLAQYQEIKNKIQSMFTA